ncbi:hypothetical protein ATANTOWER_011461 [Ataeniobius toweri]|uniref:Uncharacterized protein n=1 Tax=Ataeniobius toweri TaxID=208326 RepID=A0ABU7B2Y1_9TELE|nr:hypothetical protein [Ataeniobius toweri]
MSSHFVGLNISDGQQSLHHILDLMFLTDEMFGLQLTVHWMPADVSAHGNIFLGPIMPFGLDESQNSSISETLGFNQKKVYSSLQVEGEFLPQEEDFRFLGEKEVGRRGGLTYGSVPYLQS